MSSSTLKWKKHFSESQNLYYWHNSETDEKFWDIEDKNDPRFWVQLKSKSKDPKKPYWYNFATHESQWQNPGKEEEVSNVDTTKTSMLEETPKVVEPISGRKASMIKLKERVKKKKEASAQLLEKSKKNEKSSNIDGLSEEVVDLKLEKKEEKPEVKKDKSSIKPKKSYSSYFDKEPEFKSYDIVNGNCISHTISATDKYDAWEQMRDIAQSLNPYD